MQVRLLSGIRARGTVDSIAHGIADRDNPTGTRWARRTQLKVGFTSASRLAVRVSIDADSLPEGTVLAAGMTATLTLNPS